MARQRKKDFVLANRTVPGERWLTHNVAAMSATSFLSDLGHETARGHARPIERRTNTCKRG